MTYSVRQNLARYFTAGRQGNPINKIFIHHAATTDFDGIGNTFRNREASAHYGVGRNNNVDVYVPEGSIAWHCGNWAYNATSIGIENVNSGGAAEGWPIATETFNTLVALVYDIARGHGLLPLVVGKNLFGHKDVSPTACPGVLYDRLQEIADRVNKLSVPNAAINTSSRNDQISSEVIAGKWGNGEDRKHNLANAGYDYNAIQAIVNSRLGASPPQARESATILAQQVIAGAWGNGEDRRTHLILAGYDYNEVQSEVNRLLGVPGTPVQSPMAKSVDQIATEVIRGDWGNGDDRRNRLQSAGYNYDLIQAQVNRKLG
jgi:N-acetylmuramoyl-L-alanine amidase